MLTSFWFETRKRDETRDPADSAIIARSEGQAIALPI